MAILQQAQGLIGIAVILAALTALEASPLAGRVGYDVMINSDEETGSQASAGLIAELARGKTAALTYEPALPDGSPSGIEVLPFEVPGKGVLFEEELAKTGSSDKTQIYGEIGLKYGNALAHGVLRGLAV